MALLVDGLFAGALEYLGGWFARFHYLAPFTVLLLCGVGLPLPEEVTLIGCGVLVYHESVDFVAISLVCSAAILLGDSIPYWLGRHWGLSALRLRFVAKLLHPERFAKLERKFAANGNWAVFTCRFLPGLRIPGYFVAGTLRMSYTRFLVLDGLGVLVSVPTSIWVAHLFGGTISEAAAMVSRFNHGVLAGLVFVIVVIVVWTMVRKKRRRARELAQAALEVDLPHTPLEIATLQAVRSETARLEAEGVEVPRVEPARGDDETSEAERTRREPR